eukprot:10066851-Alexandrium_andersonii.AAC.1
MLAEAHLAVAASGGHLRSPSPIDAIVASLDLASTAMACSTPGPGDHDFIVATFCRDLQPE